jgi:hypothetical protein
VVWPSWHSGRLPCGRAEQYRIDRLLERFGPGIALPKSEPEEETCGDVTTCSSLISSSKVTGQGLAKLYYNREIAYLAAKSLEPGDAIHDFENALRIDPGR